MFSMSYSFLNDYGEGCHPTILDALSLSNMCQESGYGEDEFCLLAASMIRERCNLPNADVHFVSGGTQANQLLISSALKPYEAVVAAVTAHVAVHETGAIEATGHKVCVVETSDGKLTPENVGEVLAIHTDEHMVKPRLIYVSDTTEIGTVYTKSELLALASFCKENGLFLYIDGARLAQALTSDANDMSLEEFAAIPDAFYIGGTKNGALMGEAIVINNDSLKRDFRYCMKQRGALLAKGRILGVQFVELFKDNLFFENGRHANECAMRLAKGIKKHCYGFLTEPVSNQIFPIFPNSLISDLEKRFSFYVWKKCDATHSALRLVTSWATPPEMIDEFVSALD